MTEPRSATRPVPTSEPATGAFGVDLPDEARLRAEIGEDGRHEWFLVRAALVAALVVAAVVAAVVVTGAITTWAVWP